MDTSKFEAATANLREGFATVNGNADLAQAIGRLAADWALAVHAGGLLRAALMRPVVKPNPKLERVTDGR